MGSASPPEQSSRVSPGRATAALNRNPSPPVSVDSGSGSGFGSGSRSSHAPARSRNRPPAPAPKQTRVLHSGSMGSSSTRRPAVYASSGSPSSAACARRRP